MKPTPSQIGALRLAERDAIRYYKGGWYSIPAMYGNMQQYPSPEVFPISVSPQTLRACEARGWLVKEMMPTFEGIYAARWYITDAGRAVLEACQTA